MDKLQFIEDRSTGIEVVSMEHVSIAYPPHTHAGHYVFGIVMEGKIQIHIADTEYECSEGEYFSVQPDASQVPDAVQGKEGAAAPAAGI
ncbi:MAG: AraC family ligand binding domain-containing protein [Eubacterium sp.]|nr:AraC family ligand binding domain-containing protein [Eubacterium sp.]